MAISRKVFIKTYGCQMNVRESEQLALDLRAAGHEIVNSEKEADVFILNTCSVREQAEIKAIGKSGFLARRKKYRPNILLGIVGCMAENLAQKLLDLNPRIDFIIGPRRLNELKTIISKSIDKPILLVGDGNADDDFLSKHDYSVRSACASVSIMNGCNMRCSYCIVPKTRGQERYRPIEEIVDECRDLADHDIKEVLLLGQIVNNYGISVFEIVDKKSPFVQLLERLNDIPGLARIRYISPHPKGFRADLIDAHARLNKLCPSVHLPVQSGSDRILKLMKRPYSRKQICSIISELRSKVPGISITTDVIVGFPGETEQDFDETVALFEAVKFNMAYIFKYSPRAGTVSATLPDDVLPSEKDRRNKILLDIVQRDSLLYNQSMLGTEVAVLVDGPAKRGEGKLSGRTANGYKVIFDGPGSDIGEFVNVKIEDFGITALYGSKI